MIVVRNVFHLEFGKTREALALIKEGVAIQKRAGFIGEPRILTDVTGPFYTIVLELALPSLASMETELPKAMADKDWQANYRKLVALVKSGSREIYQLVE
jgi:hypothetical protein